MANSGGSSARISGTHKEPGMLFARRKQHSILTSCCRLRADLEAANDTILPPIRIPSTWNSVVTTLEKAGGAAGGMVGKITDLIASPTSTNKPEQGFQSR